MPTYLYTGDRRFINDAYGVRVEPGDSCTTKFFLPQSWNNFQLTQSDVPPAITPHTLLVTVADPFTEVDVTGYGHVSIINTIAASSVAIRFGDPDQALMHVLGDKRSELDMRIAENIGIIYLTKLSGAPVVNILLSPGSAIV